jgi:hypothetical protein
MRTWENSALGLRIRNQRLGDLEEHSYRGEGKSCNRGQAGLADTASPQMGPALIRAEDLVLSECLSGGWKDGQIEVPTDKCNLHETRIHGFCL